MTVPLEEDKRTDGEPTLIQSLLDGLHNGRQLANRIIDLATVEGRLAILSVVEMLALGVVVALLAVTIWLLVLAALAATLILLGLAWPWTLLLLAALSAVALLLGIRRVRALSDNLRFAATRQVLLGATAASRQAPPQPPMESPHADARAQAPG